MNFINHNHREIWITNKESVWIHTYCCLQDSWGYELLLCVYSNPQHQSWTIGRHSTTPLVTFIVKVVNGVLYNRHSTVLPYEGQNTSINGEKQMLINSDCWDMLVNHYILIRQHDGKLNWTHVWRCFYWTNKIHATCLGLSRACYLLDIFTDLYVNINWQ